MTTQWSNKIRLNSNIILFLVWCICWPQYGLSLAQLSSSLFLNYNHKKLWPLVKLFNNLFYLILCFILIIYTFTIPFTSWTYHLATKWFQALQFSKPSLQINCESWLWFLTTWTPVSYFSPLNIQHCLLHIKCVTTYIRICITLLFFIILSSS